jgi:arginase family enzyme
MTAEGRSHGDVGATPGATRPPAYHAGIPTFMRRPIGNAASLRPGVTAVFGIPFDYTSGSRPGARWGPRGIRQSSAWTGGIVLDGLEARQPFEAVSVFARHPVAALDLTEVAPNYDPAETTIRLAAQALFQFLVERAPLAGQR